MADSDSTQIISREVAVEALPGDVAPVDVSEGTGVAIVHVQGVEVDLPYPVRRTFHVEKHHQVKGTGFTRVFIGLGALVFETRHFFLFPH